MRRLLVLAAAAVFAVLTGMAVAQASIPSADGSITGCYHGSTGALRIIDADVESCPSGYTALTWPSIDTQGLTGRERVRTVTEANVPTGSALGALARCPAGKIVLSGGYDVGLPTGVDVRQDKPMDAPAEGWEVTIENDSGSTQHLQIVAFALCANVAG
jgi:hypothetical protein